jgi:hypothetical protein
MSAPKGTSERKKVAPEAALALLAQYRGQRMKASKMTFGLRCAYKPRQRRHVRRRNEASLRCGRRRS